MNSIWRQVGVSRAFPLSSPAFPLFTRHGASLVAPGAIPEQITESPRIRHCMAESRLRKRLPTRPGLIGTKRGMISWFNEKNEKISCTVLEIDSVEVTHVKTVDTDGYAAVQLGACDRTKGVKATLLGHFARATVTPKRKLLEFSIKTEDGLLPLGTHLKADHFKIGDHVDVQSVSRGKGFAGVMKRWGFSGMPASHGVSGTHRHGGSYGGNQDPGRVLPGKKMSGHMGSKNNTIQNLLVIHVDAENGYILVKGPVSGAKGTFVKIQDAKKSSDGKKAQF